jgi:hypothetical protein
MDIDKLEINDLYNEKNKITQETLPTLLNVQTQLCNNIDDFNKLQQHNIEELINLETKGYHGNDATTYASQYWSGTLCGMSNKPLGKAKRFIPPGAKAAQAPPVRTPVMNPVDVRCRERCVQNYILDLQTRKEQLIERLEQATKKQTKAINDLCQITLKIQNKEDPEDQGEEEHEENEDEGEEEGEEEHEEDEDEGEEEDEDEGEEEDEMESDEDIAYQNIMNALEC